MPALEASPHGTRKRCIEEAESEDGIQRHPSLHKPELKGRRYRTASSFWDNLSRQHLTRRALREFDRRTDRPGWTLPPHQTGKESINLPELKRFARHGGANIDDIRGFPIPKAPVTCNPPTMSPSQPSSQESAKPSEEADASRSRRVSVYDPAFRQHLIDHGIYPERDEDDEDPKEPANMESISQRLVRRRSSLSPSRFTRTHFSDFKKKNREAQTESKVMSQVFPVITGTVEMFSQENVLFGNLKDITTGTLARAKPDFYDGIRPATLPKSIRDKLGCYIVPSTITARPCLPNFFAEGKGPDASPSVSELQAAYAGALGARGIHELRSYVDPETAYDENAYTITATYHGGNGLLNIYTTHCLRSTDTEHDREYHMAQLGSWPMTISPDDFRRGAGALRNARDWAKEQRDALAALANRKFFSRRGSASDPPVRDPLSSTTERPGHHDLETSADESLLDSKN